MGGRGRSRTQRKHFAQSRENVWKRSKFDSSQPSDSSATADAREKNNGSSNSSWEPFATQNPAFDDYYKEQGIVSREEWDTFNEYLRKPLPAAFRINSSCQNYMDIRSKLENDFVKSLQAEITDGSEVDAIRPLPWYPENLSWQSNFSRNQLRKTQTLERFHEFLKLQNEIGNITRQEAVSMVPPLFLDVRPDHFVLDMCAAPGSKTFQLLEMIYHSVDLGSLPSGMVIANDVDVQRCNLLIHQTKRMCTANLIVTNHEAQHFPSCNLNRHRAESSEIPKGEDIDITQLLYDRVLCDVPCSGDGTLRKAPDIWRKWNAGNGNGLHGLQVQIAMRGMSLLKVGGRMIYSTCSMNPIENEAVVAEVLRRCGESVELVDVSGDLPQLIRRPGLKKWKIRDKGVWLYSYKDVPKARRAAIVPGMFPSGKSYADGTESCNDSSIIHTTDNVDNRESTNGASIAEGTTASSEFLEEEVSTLPLERCMRIVPHDQNTGAFFIAVFQKLSPLPADSKQANLPRKMRSTNGVIQTEKIQTVVREDTDPVEGKLTEISASLPESTVDSDAVDNGMVDNDFDGESGITPKENEADDIESSKNIGENLEMVRGKRKLQIQGRWKGVDPVIFYREEEIVSKIKDFYGIKESFPFDGHLITRNSDTNHVKRIYYVSESVKKVLGLNFRVGQQLKIASVGLKMFERQTSKDGTSAPCLFRISSEGLPLLLPHITKQILHASPVDFKRLLEHKSVKFGNFVDADLGEKASNLSLGCCVVILNKESGTASDPPQVDASTVAIGCWRGRTNVSVMVTSLDCQELLERMPLCTGEDTVLSLRDGEQMAVDDSELVPDGEPSAIKDEV
ncbi:hypothetical protein DM860_009661 [Cuscuta australis]|uniref:SAM-dependent MTase RsmB/NOP-type domain-containing protein n=1 Tax=Cuscuta australis TaxID=267555 RepID=A0A328DJM1_9ASTE|nr:hypothetical protein DM860_009661 [Cuscuta australis]